MVLINLHSTGLPNPSDFEVNYNVPLEFPPGSEVALIGCNMEYSWYNISEKIGNNKIKFDDPTSKTQHITLPDGLYNIEDIQDYINDYFRTDDPPIKFEANHVTFKTNVFLKTGYKLHLGNLSKILGFKDKKEPLEGELNVSSYKADITNGVNRILLHCSAVGGSYANSFPNDVIYSFTPKEEPGSILIIQPPHPIYLPLKELTIRSIRMRITDQANRSIDLNQTNIDYLINILTSS